MFGIPFLSAKNEKSDEYVFILFLSGIRAYGFAFSKKDAHLRSAVYSEHTDSFLKEATKSIEKIIGSVEKDLGEGVYLRKCVLFLGSLYTTDAGSIREDYLAKIKKLTKDLDLVNLGYVNLYEAVSTYYGEKYINLFFTEENEYDYCTYEIYKGELIKVERKAKTQNEAEVLKEVYANLDDKVKYMFFSAKSNFKVDKHVEVLEEKEIREMFMHAYFKNDAQETSEEGTENQGMPTTPQVEEESGKKDKTHSIKAEPTVVAGVISAAPGFKVLDAPLEATEDVPAIGEVDSEMKTELGVLDDEKGELSEKTSNWPDFEESETNTDSDFAFANGAAFSGFTEKKTSFLPKTKKGNPFGFVQKIKQFKLPRQSGFALLLIPLGLFVFLYLNFVSRADISVVTKKENFSEKVNFEIGANGLASKYSENYDFKINSETSGENQIGEKASGEIAIYNKQTKEINLEKGSLFKKSGINFVLSNDVTVPSATDAGKIIVKGEKIVDVTAESIGAEGNIDKGSELVSVDYPEGDLYAVANTDFKGGYKKTVAVFSEEDKAILEKKALERIKRDLQNNFYTKHTRDNLLFLATTKLSKEEKKYSLKVNEEGGEVLANYKGQAQVYYLSKHNLESDVQKKKLSGKEFVENTFKLANIKLLKEEKASFKYSAVVKGQVQHFIDKTSLLNNLAGKGVSAAEKIIRAERNVSEAKIIVSPLDIKFIPFNKKRIFFHFVESL
jgi:hypothetical protein